MDKLAARLGHYAPFIDYLQRSELDHQLGRLLPDEIHQANSTVVSLSTPLPIVLLQIAGVSRQPPRPEGKNDFYRSTDVIAGLHGQGEPIYFLIISQQHQVRLYFGSTDQEGLGSSIQALLESQYPGVQLSKPISPEGNDQREIRTFLANCPHAGILTGIPVSIPGEDQHQLGSQIDRLIRGMANTAWAFLVIAEPKDESQIIEQKLAYYNEQNRLEQEEGFREISESRISTIAGYYDQLLKEKHFILDSCLYDGGWSAQTYLCAPEAPTYRRMKALVKSTFSSSVSKGVRLRVIDALDMGRKIASFSPVLAPGPLSPSNELKVSEHNNNKYLTLLSSAMLSALIHLPKLEMPGYFVRDAALFDVAPHIPATEPGIKLGEILDRSISTHNTYRVREQDLTRHALLVGITGSGKTNTGFYLLQQLAQHDPPIPFLVIEPAKREYRRLFEHASVGQHLQVFTVGEETSQAAPFRINPFEIQPGVPVQTHIDLLKSVFNASFGMWSPLPQVLERAIIAIYQDKGWDPVQNTNWRGQLNNGWHPEAQPTMTDLFNKVGDLVPSLGYDEETSRNVRTALETRINSLRVGAKGMMLDTSLSVPIETLINYPTILELEGIGDDDEKVFFMGLILTRLYEYYRSQPGGDGSLRHITVIEEAHRLLSNAPPGSSAEVGNPRGKAVETFVNMLSEVRAYGEGFIIAEQIPTKLAPDVIKNTALKIMHRTVSSDDRIAMGNAMNLSNEQLRQVVALETGQAVVYGGGKFSDDNPILISVPLVKFDTPAHTAANLVRRNWEAFIQKHKLETIYLAYTTCDQFCQTTNSRCRQVKHECLDETLRRSIQRSLLSIVTDQIGPVEDKGWEDVKESLISLVHRIKTSTRFEQMPFEDFRCATTHLVYDFLRQRAGQRGWHFRVITELAQSILPAFHALWQNRIDPADYAMFSTLYSQHSLKERGPFYGCDAHCPTVETKRLCLFYEAAARFINSPMFKDSYEATAYEPSALLDLGEHYANRILSINPNAYLSSCAQRCFLLQAIDADSKLSVIGQRNLVDALIRDV